MCSNCCSYPPRQYLGRHDVSEILVYPLFLQVRISVFKKKTLSLWE